MLFSKLFSAAALAASAMLACAKPVVVARDTTDPILPLIQALEKNVVASATRLDGIIDPTEIIAEIVGNVTATVNSLVTITVHYDQIAKDVDAIVNATSATYTAVTAALEKYGDATVKEIVDAVEAGETAFANIFSTLLEDVQTFIPFFVNKVVSAVEALDKLLGITLTLKLKLTILGLTIVL